MGEQQVYPKDTQGQFLSFGIEPSFSNIQLQTISKYFNGTRDTAREEEREAPIAGSGQEVFYIASIVTGSA